MEEKMVTIEELKELRDKLKNQEAEEKDYMKIFEMFPSNNDDEQKEEQTQGKEEAYQLTKTNPSMPSLLDKKAGFSNVIYLATMSLVFEILFLAVSFLIYK